MVLWGITLNLHLGASPKNIFQPAFVVRDTQTLVKIYISYDQLLSVESTNKFPVHLKLVEVSSFKVYFTFVSQKIEIEMCKGVFFCLYLNKII